MTASMEPKVKQDLINYLIEIVDGVELKKEDLHGWIRAFESGPDPAFQNIAVQMKKAEKSLLDGIDILRDLIDEIEIFPTE